MDAASAEGTNPNKQSSGETSTPGGLNSMRLPQRGERASDWNREGYKRKSSNVTWKSRVSFFGQTSLPSTRKIYFAEAFERLANSLGTGGF
jgi:hypothetical protein